MLTEERRKKIIEIINTDGIAEANELSNFFDVSIYTIRRDLSELERKELIKKTHGGAIKVEKSAWLPTVEDGMKEAIPEKKAIAKKAASYIENGDTIFLTGSTISLAIIQHIQDYKLTVVTNSLDVGKALSMDENIETILIGGKVKNYKGNILGSHAVCEIGGFYFDKAFIPCAGIEVKAGVTTSTIESADFTRAVINSARESILVADYRKIGRVTFAKICGINCINRLITDSKADKDELDRISKKGVLIDTVLDN